VVRRLAGAGAAGLLFLAAPASAEECRSRLLPPAAAAPGPKRTITAGDLIELRDFGIAIDMPGGDPPFSLSPDGRHLAMLLRSASVAANNYCLGLLAIDLETRAVRLLDVGGEPTLILADMHGLADQGTGAFDALRPLWSPDGQWLAYQRRIGGVTQLWRVAAAGAAAEQLTHGASDIRRFAWTADGQGLVFAVRGGIAEARAAFAAEGDAGYLYDTRFWPLSGDRPEPPANIPLAYFTYGPGNGAVRAASATERALLLPAADPRFPAGTLLRAESGTGDLAWVARRAGSYLGPQALGARVSGRLFACAAEACDDRIIGLWWWRKGEILFLRDWGTRRRGEVALFRWRPGSAPVSLFRTTDPLNGCLRQGGALLCGREAAGQPRRLVRILPTGETALVFDPNPEFRRVALGPATRLAATALDGAPAFGDLVLPPDHRPGQRHPLVVVQYNSRGFLRGGTGDEYPVHLLAARGYAVLSFQRPTPAAYGTPSPNHLAYQKANIAGWADRRRVFSALDRLVDAALATGAVDADRIAITGLSDGTATVQWALLHSRRYRVAVMSTCCEDPSTTGFAAGPAFAGETRGWGYPAPGEKDPAFWREYSLARNAGRVEAPILVQAADREYRLALETVASLRAAGKPIELYVFPDEYHIKWQPRHRRAVYERVLDWLDFWLLDRQDRNPAKTAQYARWKMLRAGASAEASRPAP